MARLSFLSALLFVSCVQGRSLPEAFAYLQDSSFRYASRGAESHPISSKETPHRNRPRKSQLVSRPLPRRPTCISAINSQKLKDNDPEKGKGGSKGDDEKESGRFWSFFSRDEKSTSNDKKKTEKRRKDKDQDESEGNIISRFLRSRRETAEEEKNRLLAQRLEQEDRGRKLVDPSLLAKALNTTNILSTTFQKADESISKVRQGMNSVRSSLASDESIDQSKISEIRERSRADRERQQMQLEAQRQADQRARDRWNERREAEMAAKIQNREREERKKRIIKAARERDAAKGQTEETDSEEKSQREGVLSVAQKFLSGATKSSEEWVVVFPKTRIAPGEMVPVTVKGLDLLLVASKDGSKVHCVANSCPHLGTPLEVGFLERRPIEYGDSDATGPPTVDTVLQETDISKILQSDGCEECIVCPLHRTAFALESGDVRGEWCPYPPVLGKITGMSKPKTSLPVFDVRVKGKNVEVRINSPVSEV